MTVETQASVPPPTKRREQRESVVIRFAGDSGDGMQLTGMQFTTESALAGNDIGTLPDFPAEIRAPAGTLAGVSGFQLNFSSLEVYTPGDNPDVLVAMNPAALKVNIGDLKPGGILLADQDGFDAGNLKKAGYATNPLEDGSLAKYQVIVVDMTGMTLKTVEDLKLSNKVASRCKNFFALGLCSWMYSRPIEPTLKWIQDKFKKTPELVEANARVLKTGYHFGETTELFAVQYEVKPARIAPGKYRNVTGNTAVALGLLAAAKKAGLPLFLGSYPITPASDILHELAQYKNFGVYTFQAEDEIAGVCSALGASFGGGIGVTTSSGPGIALKQEAINLAVMVELPLVICNIQRGGPSTGLPTKTEQADLYQAIFGRNSDSSLPVLAAATPGDCFNMAYEAVRIAIRYMTPVFLLTDGYLANGAEPWLIPKFEDLPSIPVQFRTEVEGFFPYLRDPETLARPWVKPGTPGLEHRIGGIEKEDVTGNISYSPANHELMTRARARKVAAVAQDIPPTTIRGEQAGDLVVVGWGSTYGSIAAAVDEVRARGKKVSHVHLRYLNPLPPDLGGILRRFKTVLVPEMNMGQLLTILRATYLVDAVGLNKIQGQPFKVSEIAAKILRLLEG
ncbi:MAG: 2-oxoacid:acceptor oxidoreductase subunit alpha [candidate division NC10 bacterium]|nr:2-oxoacid:acceptor oxidoreductase subunit alpha [candidate division NC10 bacterium]MBI3085531.1 2-oxoacid:acceptor oxidoreductase subunit alpha [candidate division NC10 bacterium]